MQINIALSEDIQNYVQEQVAIGGYATAAEYFLALVQQDRKRKAQEQLEEMLLEGMNSDEKEVTPEFWQQMRESVLGGSAVEGSENSTP